jgi:hypothetical protein
VTAIVHPPSRRRRPWRTRVSARPLVLLALGAVAAASVAACGSSPATSSAALYGTAIQQQCTSVADVLSDGPDPTADPTGYAEAQVLPLRQLKISDAELRRAVQQLATAYQSFSTSTGTAGTAAAVQASKDEAAVNAICPGAAN